MKKLILTLSIGMMLVGCGGNSEKEQTSAPQNEAIKKEVVAIDSVATLMDEAKSEIDTKNEELDELLNDL